MQIYICSISYLQIKLKFLRSSQRRNSFSVSLNKCKIFILCSHYTGLLSLHYATWPTIHDGDRIIFQQAHLSDFTIKNSKNFLENNQEKEKLSGNLQIVVLWYKYTSEKYDSMSNHPDLDTLTSQIYLKFSTVTGIMKTGKSWKFELLTHMVLKLCHFLDFTWITFHDVNLLLWILIYLNIFSLKSAPALKFHPSKFFGLKNPKMTSKLYQNHYILSYSQNCKFFT